MFTESFPHIIVGISAFILGIARAGINVFNGIPTPLLIFTMGDPKESVGIITLVAFMSDCIAIFYYRKKVDMKILGCILPLVLFGMFIAFVFGSKIATPTYLVIITIISAVAIIPTAIYQWQKHKSSLNKNRRKTTISSEAKPIRYRHFAVLISCGIAAGIGTVMGNSANIFLNLYLSELRIQKTSFIAMSAWFFFIINGIKIYFHLTYWKSISTQTVLSILPFFPLIIIGFVIGIYLIKRTTEKTFSAFVLISSIIPFLLLLKRTLDVIIFS